MNATTTHDDQPAAPDPETSETEHPQRGYEQRATWLRLLFMLVFVFLYGVSRTVLAAVIVVQFFWVLFTASPNERLTGFGQSLATYTYQIVCFLTYVSEERPFPFEREWPDGPPQ